MSSDNTLKIQDFVDAINDAASMLERSPLAAGNRKLVPVEPLPSLLEQCRTVCEQNVAAEEPIRTIHHFACTGGTLISKCIAAMPNVELLSEIDPLSSLRDSYDKPQFAPTDILYLLRQSARKLGDDALVNVFIAAIAALNHELSKLGRRLVIRDHTHSHFCASEVDAARPTVRKMLRERFSVQPILTVRHPIDSYISLESNGWVHFEPSTFDEYCRRYLLFLDAYHDVPVFKYEDFVREPGDVMRRICNALALPFDAGFLDTMHVIRLTGDSGRAGGSVSERPRRNVSKDLQEQTSESETYKELCRRLGYSQIAEGDQQTSAEK